MTDDVDLYELLNNLTADLVSEARHEPVLHRLFARPAGAWHELEGLCAALPGPGLELAGLRAAHGVRLYASWHETPARPGDAGEGFCVIVFYSPEWNGVPNTAVYNKRRLSRRTES